MAHELLDSEIDGHAVRVLRSPAGVEAAFAPGVGMVGCSLRHRGEELLGQRGGLAAYAETGSTFGLPLLHPWANRLDGLSYDAGGVHVGLAPERMPLRLDPNGLPIHGLAAASPHWRLAEARAGEDDARLAAVLPFGERPELLAGFPFPHDLRMDVRLAGAELSVETTLRATGDSAVPVAFGYHPYLRLPGAPRAGWEVTLPVRSQGELDERGIPTGEAHPVDIPTGPLGHRAYDDLFDALEPDPAFAVSGAGRRLEVAFDAGYPVAQVFAPADQEFICFEPMTAPTNALVTGGPALRLVAPGEPFSARFRIRVGSV